MPRTLFIWDIHGCYDELVELYDKMQISESDRVYATGDLINKWPYSQKVVHFIREKNIQSVLGNHDVKFIRCLDWIEKKTNWFDAIQQDFQNHEDDIEFLKSLPYWIEDNNFLLIHAWLIPGKTITEQLENDSIVTLRLHEGRPWHDYYEGTKKIIYGHWAVQLLRITANTVGLDTWCVWWWHLTGYCFETGEIWQVRAKRMYGDYWDAIK